MAVSDTAVIRTTPRPDFVQTAYVDQLTERALGYVSAGFPVHFRGPSGVGKTTLALHVAHRLGRPVMLITGDDEFGTSDLVGAQVGYRRRRVVDNFVHSVLKTEDDVSPRWVDNRLTVACREGFTLVYDEFTRSRPEANNTLLSVLEERMLVLPAARGGGADYLRVHPDFVALFTSNPVEYAGVHQSQDALLERMVTMDVGSFDAETETEIVRARSGVSDEDALTIVELVRACRRALGGGHHPTVRSAVVIARVLAQQGAAARAEDQWFQQVCLDVLASDATRRGWEGRSPEAIRAQVMELVYEYAGGSGQHQFQAHLAET